MLENIQREAGTISGEIVFRFELTDSAWRSVNGRVRAVSEICCGMRARGENRAKSQQQDGLAQHRGALDSLRGIH
jgi:hypothetical protein